MPSIETFLEHLALAWPPSYSDIAVLIGVVWLDIALAADNAIAVGLAAAALPNAQRRSAISLGILVALLLRVAFALGAVWLLQIRGLLLVGGLVLFWVAGRMWADLRAVEDDEAAGSGAAGKPPSFLRALVSIIVADVSMSLDNVLSVAAVARHSPVIMAIGLVLSVLLMGIAASFIARIVNKHKWIAVIGIIVILAAAVRMIWEDGHNFLPQYVPALPHWLAPPHPPA